MGIIYTARKDVINELFLKKKFFFKEKLRQKGDFRELTILERAQVIMKHNILYYYYY